MGYYTEYTARWLDRRYVETDEQGRYCAHMPIYGLYHPSCEGGHLARFARVFQILRELNRLDFASCVDIGGGEGYLSHVVRHVFGVDVLSCDLSAEACARAFDLFEVDAVAIDSARLPFADDSFDVVVCSEVIEHLEYPVECLLELRRVARKAVILTTEELEQDRAAIARHLFRRCGYPHFERNLFHPDDLRLIFGDGIDLRSQFRDTVPDEELSLAAAATWIHQVTALDGIVAGGRGVVMRTELTPDVRRATPWRTDDELVATLLHDVQVADGSLVTKRRDRAESRVIERCVCPVTRQPLVADGTELVANSGQRYETQAGVPVLYDLSTADPSEDDLRRRLEDYWPGNNERIEAALQLRSTLVLPFDAAKTTWDFRTVTDRRGWMPAETMVEQPCEEGGLTFAATDADPWFASPGLRIDAGDLACLVIRMRTHNPDYPIEGGDGQVFWMTDTDTTLDESRSITFAVRNEDRLNEYRIDLASAENWPDEGRILFLRIDPANGPCEIELRSVSIGLRGAGCP